MAPGSLTGEATSIFQEGLRLPAIKIISRGRTIEPVMQVIKVNSRMPDVLEGDLWAAIASVRVGARRLEALADKYGTDTFTAAIESFMDFGEKASRRALGKLPGGTFELSEEQDNGQVYHVRITIAEDRFTVDLRDNPDQLDGPLNTSRDGRHGRRADDLQVADRSLLSGEWRIVPSDPVADPQGLGVRRERAGSARLLLRDRAARVRSHVALPGEPHARPPGGRPLRVGPAARSSAASIPTPAGSTR